MGFIESEIRNELLALRDTQGAAQPAQPLDNSTLLVAEIKRVRNLDAVTTPLETNIELEQAWDGLR